MLDYEKLAKTVLAGTKALIAKEAAPLLAKIADLEAQLAVKPRDGKDADPDVIRSMVDEAVAALPKPQDGQSVTAEDVAPLIDAAVSKAVAEIPAPRDGKDGADGKDADPAALDALKAEAETLKAEIEALKSARARFMVDADGELVVSQDGDLQKLGRVRGKDGASFERAEIDGDGVLVLRRNDGEAVRAGVVKGRDGLGFDDLEVAYDGERRLTFTMARGETEKTFALSMPLVIDRGVFKAGTTYAKGDAVTSGGSLWIAQEDTDSRPETDGTWRLAVKRGRDGRDGKAPAPQGPVKSMGGGK